MIKVVKCRVELVEQLCRAHGCSRFVSFLPFLTIYRGPDVGLPCHRRRRRSFVDGHDALLTPPFSLFYLQLASILLCLTLGGFFWLDLVAQVVGNGLGWLVVLEGWCFGELPLPLITLIFFLSCRFNLSTGAATPFAPLVRPGRPPDPSLFPRRSSDLIRRSSPAALSIR